MQHWEDPRERGLFAHPAAPPPRPSPPYANDLGARLARVEEHLYFGAIDRRRIEEESRLRAKDLGEAIMATREKSDEHYEDLDSRLSVLEQESQTNRTLWSGAGILFRSGKDFVRYVAVGLIALLIATGQATVDRLKPILSLIGLDGR